MRVIVHVHREQARSYRGLAYARPYSPGLNNMMILSPWRADFPAIAALQRQGQTYLDNAATTQKPQALLDLSLIHI